jgi:methionine biosynthesis protein MetW
VDKVLIVALRVGKKVVVGFPNFAHYKSRLQMFFQGRTPVTGPLPYQWYETPNLHFLSISDFKRYCRLKGINIERSAYIGQVYS